MLTPWKPGQAGNPSGKRGEEFEEVRRLAKTASVDAITKLINKMDSDDDRVGTIAIQGVLTWAFGKPPDYDPNEDKKSGLRFDIQALTPEERAVLLAIIRRGAVRQADPDATPETVDGTAEPAPAADVHVQYTAPDAASPDSTPSPAPKPKRRR